MGNELTSELLMMLFEELGLDFEEWAGQNLGWESWTDQEIYAKLPDEVKENLGEIVLNWSWYHGGM